MKAIVQNGYGSADVLELREVDDPSVGDDNVLVRVRAASVHPDVWHMISGLPYVLRHSWANGGAYAEYVSVPENALALKPGNVTFEQAAAAPTTGFIALQLLRQDGRSQAGEQVLINGAGGGVGTIAVQLAKAVGAHVTGVDSTEKLDLDAMATLKELLEAGKLTPVIDRTFPLSEAAEAIRYLSEGQARGKVVLTM